MEGECEMEKVRIAKITSNDHTEMIYIPKEFREALNLRKGMYVKLFIEGKRLIIEPLELAIHSER
jgi:AbrB family looped-hinge helix DNA binding protein